MPDKDLALYIQLNEPVFDYGGKQYSVCCPDGTFATWDSDGNTGDFPDVNALLDGWVIDGKPFREVAGSVIQTD